MKEQEVREGLGLTSERSEELVGITRSIMDQTSSQDGHRGITSHTLLTILGRKDLSELEKVFCTYMFCRMTRIPEKMCIPEKKCIPSMISNENVIDIDIADFKKGAFMNGMMITSPGVEPRELASVLITMLVALLGQLPEDEAKRFCQGASLSFIKMAMTGNMKL